MSRSGDLRDDLETIAGMAPLSDRERTIARMIFVDGDYDDIKGDAKWYGDAALSAVRMIDPDFQSDADQDA